jgi:hypothetical protein
MFIPIVHTKTYAIISNQTPLGYCAIRLITSGGEYVLPKGGWVKWWYSYIQFRIAVDGKYNVPVASVFPPKYFDLENRENLLRVLYPTTSSRHH